MIKFQRFCHAKIEVSPFDNALISKVKSVGEMSLQEVNKQRRQKQCSCRFMFEQRLFLEPWWESNRSFVTYSNSSNLTTKLRILLNMNFLNPFDMNFAKKKIKSWLRHLKTARKTLCKKVWRHLPRDCT